MEYQTYPPHQDLSSIIKCYWTLEVETSENNGKQIIVPDGCIEMAFLLGDGIKRFTSDDRYVIQPSAMVIGQITKPFAIEPLGYVNTFAVRFYPYGFSAIHSIGMEKLKDKETDLFELFGTRISTELCKQIREANDTKERIHIIETFLLDQFNKKSNQERVVQMAFDTLNKSQGSASIRSIGKLDSSKIRDLERKFLKQVGVSPKQLGKIIRLQTALKLMLDENDKTLTQIAYDSDYYDQSHFIKDFKQVTGMNPSDLFGDKSFLLSTIFYKKE
ncbi:AraC family transcriptional regulator [Leptospira biflexa]|uniref:AraC family transcriptional regulator n=1 Tax=Leptospira biflexa TaxID=172 RepID=UPI00109143DD|nr:helix-turn-helix domain-containing protein [Leptospira biflexa]TGM48286.1 AraC family transcriptional regulator [Leptospira biflexa]TGM49248.1 AraC family transcriptional regulator [Leptospira biflexa]TGM54516.1 AraC family transcriptional regulator [Leptospira biflexa]